MITELSTLFIGFLLGWGYASLTDTPDRDLVGVKPYDCLNCGALMSQVVRDPKGDKCPRCGKGI